MPPNDDLFVYDPANLDDDQEYEEMERIVGQLMIQQVKMQRKRKRVIASMDELEALEIRARYETMREYHRRVRIGDTITQILFAIIFILLMSLLLELANPFILKYIESDGTKTKINSAFFGITIFALIATALFIRNQYTMKKELESNELDPCNDEAEYAYNLEKIEQLKWKIKDSEGDKSILKKAAIILLSSRILMFLQPYLPTFFG
ncbi:hypothetical protein L3Y34_002350 [Caenorhabditis briggsae]|nr:hypothetical protein L3Y34_002350 [Caenorhabditis briggsae]